MLLAVNMVVRDEADHIEEALASVLGMADEVVVHDTGSVDDTVARARATGARVVEGTWAGDFAIARNVALTESHARWVLQLDADERWRGDPEALRVLLADTPDRESFDVAIDNPGDDSVGGGFTSHRLSIFPRAGTRWQGRVHEVPTGPGTRRRSRLPAHVGSVLHIGYATAAVLQRKGERNAELARESLAALLAEGVADGDRLARVLLDLGRSLFAAHHLQDAVEALEAARGLVGAGQTWAEATDFLTRVLSGAGGHDEVVLGLADQLQDAGVDERYCAWLRAPALAHLGHAPAALDALRGIDRLVDPAGREHALGPVREMHAAVAALVGARAEATSALVDCMAGHGRVAGRGALLAQLWQGTAEELAREIAGYGLEHLGAVVAELATVPGLGRDAAASLSAS